MNDNKLLAKAGVLVPYIIFIAFLIGESYLANFIVKLFADRSIGEWFAWAAFALGGTAFSMFELHATQEGKRVTIHDPFLLVSCWFQRKLGLLGVAIDSVIAGPLFTAAALKQTGRPHEVLLSTLSAILFASVWVPLFVFVGF